MAASQYQGHRGLTHAGNQLGDGQPRLDVAPHGVEQDEQAVHLVALLHGGEQGQHMLILSGLRPLGRLLMSLDLAHDGQSMDGAVLGVDGGRAHVHRLLLALLPVPGGGVVLSSTPVLLCLLCHRKRPPFAVPPHKAGLFGLVFAKGETFIPPISIAFSISLDLL